MSEAHLPEKWESAVGFDPYRVRDDFPILKETFRRGKRGELIVPLVYLDNAATTQKPRQVIQALVDYYEHANANVHRAIHTLGDRATELYEESRRKLARFIGAASEREIVFTRGTTEAINLVAAAWGRKFLKPGDEILLTEMEHHSNLIPWQLLAKEKQLTLRFIPFAEDGTLVLDNLEDYFTPRTRLLAITHMSNVFGTINPIQQIVAVAHQHDVPVLVDGAQSVPHMPVNVQELDCDFFALSGHKMCGPTGIGALYAKEKWLEAMDPYHGGGEMIRSVWLDRATWNDIPYKFEAGTPNIAGAVGLAAAVDYLSHIGMENIARYEKLLTQYALEQLQTVGNVRIFGQAPERGGVISFYVGNIHPHDVAQFLDADGIAIRAGHHCAQPIMRKLGIPATSRASFYFYNTPQEVDRLVQSLIKMKEFFGDGF
ncbi:MAG: cysteine desulfurase [Calditrichaeota bacterium]|nr:cysteine desulfurase [Calditrichota bacterium]